MNADCKKINKVILLGGSHHNGLGLARVFGINGIKPYGIIIGERAEKSFVRKSRYWKKTWAVESESEAIELLLKEFSNEELKPVLIPWSDGAAAAIDLQLNRLQKVFYVPSLNGKQGAIKELMDKQNQVDFAKKYHLPMAKSWKVLLEDFAVPDDMIFPCIVKPVASYEGKKLDIQKCDNKEELCSYIQELKEKGYKRILIQEFLDIDYEMVLDGCCGKTKSYFVSRNLRTWPLVGGTNSFFQVMDDKEVLNICEDVVQALQIEGFSGLFDIELFYMNGKVYLNEINWRNSGNSFFCLGTEVYYAVRWVLDVIGMDSTSIKQTCTDTTQYAMDEAIDLRHVVYNGFSPLTWWKDRGKTHSFSLWYVKDLKPTICQYLYLGKEMIIRRKG